MMIEDGYLASWDPQRKFGFIRASYGKLTLFAHRDDLQEGEPAPGSCVRFDAVQRDDGRWRARTWWIMQPTPV